MQFEINDNRSKKISMFRLLMTFFVVCIHNGVSSAHFPGVKVIEELPHWFRIINAFFSDIVPKCAVSGFFLLSAILLYKNTISWKNNIKKKIKTLLIPYIIMNTIWIIIYWIGQNVSGLNHFFSNPDNIVSDFNIHRWIQVYGVANKYPFLYPLWFLRDLFILNIFAYILKFLIDKYPKIILVLLCSLFLFLNVFPCDNFHGMMTVSGFCAWNFGYYIVKYNIDIDKYENNRYLICIFILTMITRILLIECKLNPMMNLLISRVGIFIDIVFWYNCLPSIVNGKIENVVGFLSKYSFDIYLFHEMFLSFFKKYIVMYAWKGIIFLVVEYIMLPFVIIIFTLGCSIALKALVPSMYRVVTGDRR